jgi:hypothetical protein
MLNFRNYDGEIIYATLFGRNEGDEIQLSDGLVIPSILENMLIVPPDYEGEYLYIYWKYTPVRNF